MELHFNVTKETRKEMVQAISRLTLMEPVYKGVPSCAYAVGNYTIEKDGTITFDERVPLEEAKKLMEELKNQGYETEDTLEEPDCDEEATENELSVAMPKDFFTEETMANLRKIIESKGQLMKKAFGASDLQVIEKDDQVLFPWFKVLTTGDGIAYSHFIEAICNMAKNQNRITAKEAEAPNEKYAFRCFLLRLGFIGTEYKEERKALLRNLSGSSAFKDGKRKEQA